MSFLTTFVSVLLLSAAVMGATPKASVTDYCPPDCCSANFVDIGLAKVMKSLGDPIAVRSLRKGEKVKLVSGNIVNTPLKVTVLRPKTFTEAASVSFEKGDVFYLLGQGAEGFRPAWFKGKETTVEIADPTRNCNPKDEDCWYEITGPRDARGFSIQQWWIQVQTRDGMTGWVDAGNLGKTQKYNCSQPPWWEPSEGGR